MKMKAMMLSIFGYSLSKIICARSRCVGILTEASFFGGNVRLEQPGGASDGLRLREEMEDRWFMTHEQEGWGNTRMMIVLAVIPALLGAHNCCCQKEETERKVGH